MKLIWNYLLSFNRGRKRKMVHVGRLPLYDFFLCTMKLGDDFWLIGLVEPKPIKLCQCWKQRSNTSCTYLLHQALQQLPKCETTQSKCMPHVIPLLLSQHRMSFVCICSINFFSQLCQLMLPSFFSYGHWDSGLQVKSTIKNRGGNCSGLLTPHVIFFSSFSF